jgi:hypothetical protein
VIAAIACIDRYHPWGTKRFREIVSVGVSVDERLALSPAATSAKSIAGTSTNQPAHANLGEIDPRTVPDLISPTSSV